MRRKMKKASRRICKSNDFDSVAIKPFDLISQAMN